MGTNQLDQTPADTNQEIIPPSTRSKSVLSTHVKYI